MTSTIKRNRFFTWEVNQPSKTIRFAFFIFNKHVLVHCGISPTYLHIIYTEDLRKASDLEPVNTYNLINFDAWSVKRKMKKIKHKLSNFKDSCSNVLFNIKLLFNPAMKRELEHMEQEFHRIWAARIKERSHPDFDWDTMTLQPKVNEPLVSKEEILDELIDSNEHREDMEKEFNKIGYEYYTMNPQNTCPDKEEEIDNPYNWTKYPNKGVNNGKEM